MIIIVAGVSGTGKSTIGKAISEHLHLPFFDADDFHPQSNINKMQSGLALTDEDRWPWLEKLAALLTQYQHLKGAVLACSALKECYRGVLTHHGTLPVQWIMLTGSAELLQQRLSARENHFFDGRLLATQLATLELPDYGLTVDVSDPVETVVDKAIDYIQKVI
ncbi:gluconokinase [Alteromonas sp. C1M14]|uniref:gluconokinase n=1 Tax=Alteromonas sp. C1M14 TaxID=2841567 RepID=UPI001C0A5F90|nr:gluconokinase [Alteromonas sp. C1M14]MBU2978133.1 gluconokinase [Alteromonas sp. C1M14]